MTVLSGQLAYFEKEEEITSFPKRYPWSRLPVLTIRHEVTILDACGKHLLVLDHDGKM